MRPFFVSRDPVTRQSAPLLPRFWRTKFSYLVRSQGEYGALRTLQAMARAWESQTGMAGGTSKR